MRTPPGAPSARWPIRSWPTCAAPAYSPSLLSGTSRLADIPGTVDDQGDLRARSGAVALYGGLLKEFVNLYEKTKGIHKRLNARRLH